MSAAPQPSPSIEGPIRSLREGVVAVIQRDGRFLVIRRSCHVRAPRAFCFPGGGVEPGESHPRAMLRELKEELSVKAVVGRSLWQNFTPTGVQLTWFSAFVDHDAHLIPNDAEVASVHWITPSELVWLPGLLKTNVEFLAAVQRGEIQL